MLTAPWLACARARQAHVDQYTMSIQNVGGTPGGMRTFLLGMIMAIAGGYLVFQHVQVGGGYWSWNLFGGGAGRSFGITLLPLLLGIGILFVNGKSFAATSTSSRRRCGTRW